MRKRPGSSAVIFLTLVCCVSLGVGVASDPPFPAAATEPQSHREVDWERKVAPGLLGTSHADDIEFLVILEEQADLQPARAISNKHDKGHWVFETLRAVAARSQAGIREELDLRFVEYRPFWIRNMLYVHADASTLQRIAMRDDVARLVENVPLQRERWFLDPPAADDIRVPSKDTPPTVAGIEWNIARIGAPAVWLEGVTGAGAVVGGMDTGYDWTHPALQRQYRGFEKGSVQHDYNWHDAIHRGGVFFCPDDSPEPCDGDLSGHGTHTMGTIVGDDGLGNQIGVAPGARWIGCRCWEEEGRTALAYVVECFQWFVAPTNLNDASPNPDLAPHAINNSWVCDPGEGCTDPNVLRPVVENVRAAGIVVVAGAGNDGPACSSIYYPPAIYDASLSVGATTNIDDIARFSSRGPVNVDGSQRMKPDLCAPGEYIRSCVPGGGFQDGWSGTSMATPHVTGAVALLVSAVPELAGNVDLLEQILLDTAVPLQSADSCGSLPGTAIPNPTFGHGRLDVYAAYRKARSLHTGVSDPVRPTDPPLQAPAPALHLTGRPNPFNPGTHLEFELNDATMVSLEIYDIGGRLVRRLLEPQLLETGKHHVPWDGKDNRGRALPSGVYVARMEAGRAFSSRTLTLLR